MTVDDRLLQRRDKELNKRGDFAKYVDALFVLGALMITMWGVPYVFPVLWGPGIWGKRSHREGRARAPEMLQRGIEKYGEGQG